MSTEDSLEYEIIQEPDEFQLWTPDKCGACIGGGKTREDAVRDAMRLLADLIEALEKEIA